MSVIDTLRMELSDLKALQTVTGAYSDISALKIAELRRAFEQNSIFYEQISQLYHSVRISAVMKKYIKEKQDVASFRPKTLRVALTSNHRFYGSINHDIMERFISESSSIHEDRMVVGLTGKEYTQARTSLAPAGILIFQHDTPPKVEVEAFLAQTAVYERIYIYYPRFINMLSQTVDRIDIAYFPKEIRQDYQHIDYIFEPELPKILEFFQQHIRTLLFNRVLLETQLARTAVRLLTMDTAERKSRERIGSTGTRMRKAQQSLINRRLLETFVVVRRTLNK
jgi:F0F1-type ATP synthase gamma subunit